MSSSSCRKSTAPDLGSLPLRAIRCRRRESSPIAWLARSAREMVIWFCWSTPFTELSAITTMPDRLLRS